MKLKNGRIIKLKPSYAKWHLDHPEIYFKPDGTIDKLYVSETLLHLTCCLGEPVYGRVIGESRSTKDCWLVKWKIGPFKAEYYVEKDHIEVD